MNNEFEKEVQSKRNDFNDAIVGVGVSFGFFSLIFIIGVVIEFASRM
ncbi:YqzM family protein [Geomicrobium sp. JSM 1781026]|nr:MULTISPECIES: YqzM family protein [unclassified Geomicrobium]